jgi:hypothetical protein
MGSMELEAYWQGYVGGQTPRQFLEHWHDCSLNDYVGAYVSQLPHLFGVVLRAKWKDTFGGAEQPRRSDVTAGLLGYLEAHRDEWADLPMGEVEIARFMGENLPYPHVERAPEPVAPEPEAPAWIEDEAAPGMADAGDEDFSDEEGWGGDEAFLPEEAGNDADASDEEPRQDQA